MIYGNPPIYKPLKYPLTNRFMDNETGAHWTLMGCLECAKIPIIANIIQLIDDKIIKGKTYMQFAFDLYEVNCKIWKVDAPSDSEHNLY